MSTPPSSPPPPLLSSSPAAKPPLPFSDLKFADFTPVRELNERTPCSSCGKSCKWFCAHCLTLHPTLRKAIPPIRLPVHLDVLKHQTEHNSKSTALHANILCPEDTSLFSYPSNLPEYENLDRVLLLYPGEGAKLLSEIEESSYDRVLVLDGSWSNARSMLYHTPWLKTMRRVSIRSRKTVFWRFQNAKKEDDTHLATIEGIYYLYREHWEARCERRKEEMAVGETKKELEYGGEYDNLLYFYRYMYEMIQERYQQDPTLKFCPRHKADYIQYAGDK